MKLALGLRQSRPKRGKYQNLPRAQIPPVWVDSRRELRREACVCVQIPLFLKGRQSPELGTRHTQAQPHLNSLHLQTPYFQVRRNVCTSNDGGDMSASPCTICYPGGLPSDSAPTHRHRATWILRTCTPRPRHQPGQGTEAGRAHRAMWMRLKPHSGHRLGIWCSVIHGQHEPTEGPPSMANSERRV